jgi:hypothetical protein
MPFLLASLQQAVTGEAIKFLLFLQISSQQINQKLEIDGFNFYISGDYVKSGREPRLSL